MTALELINQFDLEPDLHKEVRVAVFAYALPLAQGDAGAPLTQLAKNVINNWEGYQARLCSALCVSFVGEAEKLTRKTATDGSEMHVDIAADALAAAVAQWLPSFA